MFARGVIVLIVFSFLCYKPRCRYSSNICPMNYAPLCGTNGITYGNECMLCAAIKDCFKICRC
uniref:Si:dkey-203a12.9 n=1 Tax=Cyprinus carpio carpio TaxID=630221 RepID=A0A8C1FLR7_CYPCA